MIVALSGGAALAEPDAGPETDAAPEEPEVEVDAEDVARGLDQAAGLADALDQDQASRELRRLSHAVAVAATYAELAALIAEANQPEAAAWHLGVTAGVGGERSPDDELATEWNLSAGFTVTGPSCPLLDLSGQIGVTTPRGFGAVQVGRVCLGGFRQAEYPTVEIIRLGAFDLAGWNVRPAVDAAAVIGNARYAMAEAGLDIEGAVWHYRPDRELVALGITLAQGVLSQKVGDERRTIFNLSVDSYFGEWRFLRPPGAIGHATMTFFDMDINEIESGEVLGTFAIAPLALRNIGMWYVYFDASGGFQVTTDEEGETPAEDAAKPEVLTGAWLLGLTIGARTLNVRLENRRRLLPTLTAAAMVEDRTRASVHVDLGRVYLDGGGFQARADLYTDGDDAVEKEVESWGLDGELAIRLGKQWSAGASLEVGRSFTFADPGDDLSVLPDPAFGFRALATATWRTGAARALTE
jgi:hypothetical protein